MRILGFAATLLTLAWSIPSLASPHSTADSCRQETTEVFSIHGSINAGMAECVQKQFQPTTREVILSSPGGDVASALDIAEHFEGRRLMMRVRRQCASSCANYFLPLAGRIIVEPGGLIVLHGSIDPWTVARIAGGRVDFMAEQARTGVTESEAGARYDRGLVGFRALVARQAAFAARNQIPPGWLLYREEHADGDQIAGLSEPLGEGRYLVVEEPMIRSCLPKVEIEPFQTDLRRHWLWSFRRLGLMWTRTRPSGANTCHSL